jgi:hypothetical protein
MDNGCIISVDYLSNNNYALRKHISLTNIMAKIGRPKVPKREAKSVLLGARFSTKEIKSVERAMTESGRDKSKWLREAVNEKMERQRIDDFIRRLSQDLFAAEPSGFEAKLIKDNQTISTGKFFLDAEPVGLGHYLPTCENNADIHPWRGAKLTLWGINEPLTVKEITKCQSSQCPFYHIWFDVVPE